MKTHKPDIVEHVFIYQVAHTLFIKIVIVLVLYNFDDLCLLHNFWLRYVRLYVDVFYPTGSFGTGAGKFKVQFPKGAKGLIGR